jgi:peptide deformylase
MAVRQIRVWPDQVLTHPTQPVASFDKELAELIDDLFETLYAAPGVGLAANQIGVSTRVMVIDLDPRGTAKENPEEQKELDDCGFVGPRVYVNPEIIEATGSLLWDEGCLSIPGITETVKRHERVTVRALDKKGEPFTVTGTGLFAVALQHETDHLDGKVFADRLSKLKRDVIRRKMQRFKEEQATPRDAAEVGQSSSL